MKWAVITPTNRPEEYVKFLEAWRPLFEKHEVCLIVCQDNDKTYSGITSALKDASFDYSLLTWKDIEAKHIPTRTDMVRSWGFYQAYRWGFEYILTLDDDTRPMGDIFEAYENQFEQDSVLSEFLSVGALTTSGLEMRGFPYKDRVKKPVAVQYGGWNGVLDYDAATQLAVPKDDEGFFQVTMSVPKGHSRLRSR